MRDYHKLMIIWFAIMVIVIAMYASLLKANVDDEMYAMYKSGSLFSLNTIGTFASSTDEVLYLFRTTQSRRVLVYPIITSSGCIMQIIGPVKAKTNGTLLSSVSIAGAYTWLYKTPTGLTNITRTNLNKYVGSGVQSIFPSLYLTGALLQTNSYLIKLKNISTNMLYNLNLNMW